MTTPATFGRYEILGEIGRGGMATVYHAYDPQFERAVALKVLPREYLDYPKARERFQREARTVAGLEHAAIVPVYDFGQQDDQPFLVMRYMRGGSLGGRLDESALSLAETTAIIQRIAAALDMAHARGLLHRDIKPDNILFDEQGDAYLVDFGIVKLLDADTSTMTTAGAVMGTPAYMSPEQVHGEHEPDHRSDVYGLGVLTFELLTGRKPFMADTHAKLMMRHVLDPVPSIRDINPDLPPNLDIVIKTVMAKERDERYNSAGEFAAALNAVAGGQTLPLFEPGISAGPPAGKRLRTLRGHKDTVWGVAWSPDGGQLASASYDGTTLVWDPATGNALHTLKATASSSGSGLWAIEGHSRGARAVVWSPVTAGQLAFGLDDGVIVLWDTNTEEQLAQFSGHEKGVRQLAWSPDGAWLASGADDSTVIAWDVNTGQALHTLDRHARGVRSVAWSPDGSHLASGSDDTTLIVWSVGADTAEVAFGPLEGHSHGINSVAWSPGGQQIASASDDGQVLVWDAQSGMQIGSFDPHREALHCVAWSPDGKLVAAGAHDNLVLVWDYQSGQLIGSLQEHTESVRSLAWSPVVGGQMVLASGSFDATVIIWTIE